MLSLKKFLEGYISESIQHHNFQTSLIKENLTLEVHVFAEYKKPSYISLKR